MRALALVLGVGLALTACFPRSASLPPADRALADAARTQWPDASRAQLERGRTLALTQCAGCHGTPSVDAQSRTEWPDTVTRMSAYAGISDPAEVVALTRYYVAAAP
jgi:cytochrome c553